jgi:hypothetical protein
MRTLRSVFDGSTFRLFDVSNGRGRPVTVVYLRDSACRRTIRAEDSPGRINRQSKIDNPNSLLFGSFVAGRRSPDTGHPSPLGPPPVRNEASYKSISHCCERTYELVKWITNPKRTRLGGDSVPRLSLSGDERGMGIPGRGVPRRDSRHSGGLAIAAQQHTAAPLGLSFAAIAWVRRVRS